MHLKKLTPILYTANLKETLDYYTNVFGFTCRSFDSNIGWASLAYDEVEIMLSIPNKHIAFDAPGFTGSFYLTTNEVDQWWERLKNKVTIAYPIENFKYGMREFAVYDNNGYLIQFGQELKEDAK